MVKKRYFLLGLLFLFLVLDVVLFSIYLSRVGVLKKSDSEPEEIIRSEEREFLGV